MPRDYVLELMHQLQMVCDGSLVRWHATIPESTEHFPGAWHQTSVSAGWKQEIPYESNGWIPRTHPHTGRLTVAQDRWYLREYAPCFPSIKKSRQYTAKQLLDELLEGDQYRKLWNSTSVVCARCGHDFVLRKHLRCDPETGHISLLSRWATVARSDHARLFSDDAIHLRISLDNNPLTRLMADSGIPPRQLAARPANGVGTCLHYGMKLCELTIRGVKTTTGRRDAHPLHGTLPPSAVREPSATGPTAPLMTLSAGKRRAP